MVACLFVCLFVVVGGGGVGVVVVGWLVGCCLFVVCLLFVGCCVLFVVCCCLLFVCCLFVCLFVCCLFVCLFVCLLFSLIGGLLATRFLYLFSGESSNLAMVVHKCEGDPLPKLQFFLNERPIDLDGCPQGSCSSATFLNQHAIKGSTGHTFEEACKTEKKQGGENSSSLPYSISPGQSSSWPRD